MASPAATDWIPMSVTCPSAEQRGFTLLELLVVLALVAAISAVALPGLVKMQAAWSRRVEADDLLNQVRSLGYRVRNDGRELFIGERGADPSELLQLPEGWALSAQPPVRYLANGACLGGRLEVRHEGTVRILSLKPPYCTPLDFQ
ncbi:hypothetical protein D3C80_160440 [compost metagenome]